MASFNSCRLTGLARQIEMPISLARYIIRASFSQERMTYIPEESKVIYQSKDGKEEKGSQASIP